MRKMWIYLLVILIVSLSIPYIVLENNQISNKQNNSSIISDKIIKYSLQKINSSRTYENKEITITTPNVFQPTLSVISDPENDRIIDFGFSNLVSYYFNPYKNIIIPGYTVYEENIIRKFDEPLITKYHCLSYNDYGQLICNYTKKVICCNNILNKGNYRILSFKGFTINGIYDNYGDIIKNGDYLYLVINTYESRYKYASINPIIDESTDSTKYYSGYGYIRTITPSIYYGYFNSESSFDIDNDYKTERILFKISYNSPTSGKFANIDYITFNHRVLSSLSRGTRYSDIYQYVTKTLQIPIEGTSIMKINSRTGKIVWIKTLTVSVPESFYVRDYYVSYYDSDYDGRIDGGEINYVSYTSRKVNTYKKIGVYLVYPKIRFYNDKIVVIGETIINNKPYLIYYKFNDNGSINMSRIITLEHISPISELNNETFYIPPNVIVRIDGKITKYKIGVNMMDTYLYKINGNDYIFVNNSLTLGYGSDSLNIVIFNGLTGEVKKRINIGKYGINLIEDRSMMGFVDTGNNVVFSGILQKDYGINKNTGIVLISINKNTYNINKIKYISIPIVSKLQYYYYGINSINRTNEILNIVRKYFINNFTNKVPILNVNFNTNTLQLQSMNMEGENIRINLILTTWNITKTPVPYNQLSFSYWKHDKCGNLDFYSGVGERVYHSLSYTATMVRGSSLKYIGPEVSLWASHYWYYGCHPSSGYRVFPQYVIYPNTTYYISLLVDPVTLSVIENESYILYKIGSVINGVKLMNNGIVIIYTDNKGIQTSIHDDSIISRSSSYYGLHLNGGTDCSYGSQERGFMYSANGKLRGSEYGMFGDTKIYIGSITTLTTNTKIIFRTLSDGNIYYMTYNIELS